MKKQILHPEVVLDCLPSIEEALDDSNLCFEELSLKDVFKELKEMVSLSIAKKPSGTWIAGRPENGILYSSNRCPTCGSRIRSGKGSTSRVRDDHCRKCGQLIDWT